MTDDDNGLPEIDESRTFVAPTLCEDCRAAIVLGARLRRQDPWVGATIVAQVALFQAATADERVQARTAPAPGEEASTDPRDLSMILAEIGCLGCFLPKTRREITRELRIGGKESYLDLARRTKAGPFPNFDRPMT